MNDKPTTKENTMRPLTPEDYKLHPSTPELDAEMRERMGLPIVCYGRPAGYAPPAESVLINAVTAWLKQQDRPVHIEAVRGLPAIYLQRGTIAAWTLTFLYERPESDVNLPHHARATLGLLSDGKYQITTNLASEADDWICGLESHCSAWWHMAHECRGGRQCTPMLEPPSYLHSELGNVYTYPPKCWPFTMPTKD